MADINDYKDRFSSPVAGKFTPPKKTAKKGTTKKDKPAKAVKKSTKK